jgi:hypothetical protein
MLGTILQTVFWIIVAYYVLSFILRAGMKKTIDPDDWYRNYLSSMAFYRREPEYKLFVMMAKEWNRSDSVIEQEFKDYLNHGTVPPYVRDHIRRHNASYKKYREKCREGVDKKE